MGTTSDKLNKLLDSKNRIKAAIEAKGVADVGDVMSAYPDKIAAIQSGGGSGGGNGRWTGHADVEGLKEIGWDDEDIEYFQKYGIYWDEEFDWVYKVGDYEKQHKDEMTTEEGYKEHIKGCLFAPKVDMSGFSSYEGLHADADVLIGVPIIDIESGKGESLFRNCGLHYYPKVRSALGKIGGYRMFYSMPGALEIDINAVGLNIFNGSLFYLSNLTRIKGRIGSGSSMALEGCSKLQYVELDGSILSSSNVNALVGLYSIREIRIDNLKTNLSLRMSDGISKASLLYMIQHRTGTNAITITLSSFVYSWVKDDADIQEALVGSNITLAEG